VSASVKNNYVQYHVSDHDSQLWVLDDFNRVSTLLDSRLLQHNFKAADNSVHGELTDADM